MDEIKAYIDDAHGNDPDDRTSLNVLRDVFEALFIIRQFLWASRQVQSAPKNYRQQRIANTYIVCYYVSNDGRAVSVVLYQNVPRSYGLSAFRPATSIVGMGGHHDGGSCAC